MSSGDDAQAGGSTAPPPPGLDPPFRGYIETTFDALLVFEAARRGMIPRVTRRLIERERGMVQSGAVFVFDEQESGIKRWTDGLIWSPSRILGNFLVYREADKRSGNPATPTASSSSSNRTSPNPRSNSSMAPPYGESSSSNMVDASPLGQGALQRPRSSSEGGNMDRQRERQLVGSLTNSYKFKDGGLVKKTMSVSVNGYAQHMISYYSVEDVMAGKLRSPSTVPELAALEISPDYLHKQNFRFPPMIEVGQDGIPRYRGEPEEPNSPQTPISGISGGSFPGMGDMSYDPYGHASGIPSSGPIRNSPPGGRSHSRAIPIPGIPGQQLPSISAHSPPGSGYMAGSPYMDTQSLPIGSASSSRGGSMRPGSSSRRYDPYGSGPTSPRNSVMGISSSHGNKRFSQPPPPLQHTENNYWQPHHQTHHSHSYGGAPPSPYDIKPILPPTNTNPYSYQPPATAPAAYSSNDIYHHNSNSHNNTSSAQPPTPTHPTYQQSPITAHSYAAQASPYQSAMPSWQSAPPHQQTSRLIPTGGGGYARDGSSGSINTAPPGSSGSGASTMSAMQTSSAAGHGHVHQLVNPNHSPVQGGNNNVKDNHTGGGSGNVQGWSGSSNGSTGHPSSSPLVSHGLAQQQQQQQQQQQMAQHSSSTPIAHPPGTPIRPTSYDLARAPTPGSVSTGHSVGVYATQGDEW